MLSGSISDHLIIQEEWGVRSSAVALFGDWERSRMESMRSWISGIGSNEVEEEQKTETLASTVSEG